jgi:cell division protein FtsB
MKKLVAISLLVLAWLQYGLWFGQSGHFAQQRMNAQLQQSEQRVAVLRQRNSILTGEVVALKSDHSVFEARARRDLGMVKSGEVFYLIPNVEL